MNDRSQIDEGWGELLGDEPPSAPSSAHVAGVAPVPLEALPPPPTFTPLLADRRRGDSVIESMQSLMKADSGAVPEAVADSDASLESTRLAAALTREVEESEASARMDAASASGSMPKLWESLWAESEPPTSSTESRDEDSFAALLPAPPIVRAPEAPAPAEDSGAGMRLAASLEPEAPARIGPDSRRSAVPSIEQSVELRRPPRVAEEVAARGAHDHDEDVPVRPSVVARVAEEAPARVRAAIHLRDDDGAANRSGVAYAANNRPRAVWLGGAALLAVAALVGVAMRGGDAPPTAAATREAQPAAAGKDSAPDVEVGKPAETPRPAADDRAPPIEREPSDAAPTPSEAAPTPSEAAASPSDAEPAPVDAEPTRATTTGSEDYATAKAEYEASGSQDALAAMVKAACALDDGPSARSAFRKLRPTELRKSALASCTATGIDPTLSLEGPTPEELVKRARRELDAGDPAAAIATARESNRMKRSRDAILVMALAACAQSNAEEARRLRKHVAKDDRTEVDEACGARGIDASAPVD